MRTSKEQIERIKDLGRELRRSNKIPMEAAAASSAIRELEAELAELHDRSSLAEPQRPPSNPASTSVRDAQPSGRPRPVATPKRPPATKQAPEVTEHGPPDSGESLVRSSIERQFEYISLGLAGLVEALWPFVEARYLREYGAEWLDVALERSRGTRKRRTPPRRDASFILGMLLDREVFKDLERSTLRLIHESRDLRNAWAHQEGPLSVEDSYRAVDTFERLIKQFDLEIPGRLLELRGEVTRELCSACEPSSPSVSLVNELTFLAAFLSEESRLDEHDYRTQQLDLLDKARRQLSYHQRRVLELCHGLNGERPRSHEEVGSLFNLPGERIRLIDSEAVRQVRLVASSQHDVAESRAENPTL